MNRCGTGIILLCGLILAGCDSGTDDPAPLATAPAVASPGGAPTFGTQSGMGFPTGNAGHTAAGSGLMGYNNTGAAGTSSAITDTHPIGAPTFATTEPVLPAP